MSVSDSKALTAFRSASVKHLAPCFCRHSSTKTMGSLTFKIAWLKCSFHSLRSPFLTLNKAVLRFGRIFTGARFYELLFTLSIKLIYIYVYDLLLVIKASPLCGKKA